MTGDVSWAETEFMYRMDDGSCEFARFAGSLPFSVLDAIEEEFKTEVVNHHDYRYWGFGSEQEMEANDAEMSRPWARTHIVPPPSEKSVLAAIRNKFKLKSIIELKATTLASGRFPRWLQLARVERCGRDLRPRKAGCVSFLYTR